jgi:hypothetical protein
MIWLLPICCALIDNATALLRIAGGFRTSSVFPDETALPTLGGSLMALLAPGLLRASRLWLVLGITWLRIDQESRRRTDRIRRRFDCAACLQHACANLGARLSRSMAESQIVS